MPRLFSGNNIFDDDIFDGHFSIKESISSTFYVQIFRTNIIFAAFSSYVLALAKNLYEKCACLTLMKLTAEQACTTYGPQAKCGPRKLLIWPERPQFLFILLVYVIKTLFACLTTSLLWPLDMSKFFYQVFNC